MDTLTADQSEDPTFIHSRVDDLGLTLAEFRVYCHLKRRANHGVAWPGIDSMAKVCRANKRTIIKAIRGLEQRQMLKVTRVEGEGNRYRLTRPSKWIGQCILGNAASAKEVTDQCTIGNGNQFILGNERVSIIEGNPLKKTPYSPPLLSETQKRLCRIFNRRLTTPWTEKELKALKKLEPIDPQDLDLIERYCDKERAKGENGIQRKDILTLLNNFPGELDRANGLLGSRPRFQRFEDQLTDEQKAMIGL